MYQEFRRSCRRLWTQKRRAVQSVCLDIKLIYKPHVDLNSPGNIRYTRYMFLYYDVVFLSDNVSDPLCDDCLKQKRSLLADRRLVQCCHNVDNVVTATPTLSRNLSLVTLTGLYSIFSAVDHIVASELKDPIWHSSEWQIGSFSSEATICWLGIYAWYINVIVLLIIVNNSD